MRKGSGICKTQRIEERVPIGGVPGSLCEGIPLMLALTGKRLYGAGYALLECGLYPVAATEGFTKETKIIQVFREVDAKT